MVVQDATLQAKKDLDSYQHQLEDYRRQIDEARYLFLQVMICNSPALIWKTVTY